MKRKIISNTFLFLFGMTMMIIGISHLVREGKFSENSLLNIIPGLIMLGLTFYRAQIVKK